MTTNEQTDAAQLAAWAEKPYAFTCYFIFPAAFKTTQSGFQPSMGSAEVITWMGAKLGDIIEARVFGHSFGWRMVTMRVKGTNGATYAGRASWDNGNVINLRRVKA